MTASSSVIDFDHLARQCFDDVALQSELLTLFHTQCLRLRPVLLAGRRVERIEAAHTLRGAALAVGAARVASCAARLELALENMGGASVPKLVVQLDEAVEDTCRLIASRNASIAHDDGGSSESLAKPISLA